MNATPNDESFKGGIREAVREALTDKEEASRLVQVEANLSTAELTIKELTESVSGKDVELAAISEERETLKTKVEELETKLSELVTKLSETDAETEKLEERATAAEKELASIAAESRLAQRMSELDEGKISVSGDAREAQEARVRELSDEEFAAYKTERTELRNQIAEEFKTAAEVIEPAAGEGGEIVAPADIEKARKEEAAAAAAATLDVEIVAEGVIGKYTEMANKMAERMREGRE